MTRQLKKHRTGRRVGFSLLEMSVASLVAAILAVGVSSSIFMSIKAVKTTSDMTPQLGFSQTLANIGSDIRFTKQLLSVSSSSLSFKVPDQTGDGADETITYSFAGGMLTRTYNGTSAIILKEDLSGVSFSASATAAAGTTPSSTAITVSEKNATSGLVNQDIMTTIYVGQFIMGNFPSDCQTWTPSNFNISLLNPNVCTGTLLFELQGATGGGWPTGQIFATASTSVDSIGTSAISVYVPFATTQAIDKSQLLTLVIKPGTVNGTVQVQTDGSSGSRNGMRTSGTLDSWLIWNNRALVLTLRGTYTPTGPAKPVVSWINVSLTPSSSSTARSAMIGLFNRPTAP